MIASRRSVTILLAEDDPEDRQLTTEALQECRLANDLHHVSDGEELMDYLYRRGAHGNVSETPRPTLILLDLNMPRMDGREALMAMKADADLRPIPVVVLTTSEADEDVLKSYDLGVSSYIAKPVTFEGLVKAMTTMGRYWFELVELPQPPRGCTT